MYHFYVVLGSNVNAKDNIPAALRALSSIFNEIMVHPRVKTTPWNVEGKQMFINTAIEFSADRPPEEVKKQLREIEHSLGRPVDLANRKTKDRTCDLDIIGALSRPNSQIWKQQPEYFIQAIFSPDSHFSTILINEEIIAGDRCFILLPDEIRIL